MVYVYLGPDRPYYDGSQLIAHLVDATIMFPDGHPLRSKSFSQITENSVFTYLKNIQVDQFMVLRVSEKDLRRVENASR